MTKREAGPVNADHIHALRDEQGYFRIIVGRGTKTEVLVITRNDAAFLFADLGRKLSRAERGAFADEMERRDEAERAS